MVSSNSCVGSSPRIKIYFLLLSIYLDELISTPKIMTFFSKLLFVNENSERESSPMPSFTDSNKQLPNVKSVFKFLIFGFSV